MHRGIRGTGITREDNVRDKKKPPKYDEGRGRWRTWSGG